MRLLPAPHQPYRRPMVRSCSSGNRRVLVHVAPDLSVLPSSAPDLLSAPTATTPAFIAVSLAFTVIFFILFTLTSFRGKMGKFGNALDKPGVQRATAWIGLLGFLIGQYPPCDVINNDVFLT